MNIINKTIILEKDFTSVPQCLARARKELKEYLPDPDFVHYVYFKAPNYNDLVRIQFIKNRWNIRKVTNEEFNEYFKMYINNKKQK